MGSLCSCCENSNQETSPKTPLLSGQQSKPVTSQQHVPSYARAQQQQQQQPSTSASTPSPQSARQHRPPSDGEKEKEFMTSLERVDSVTVNQLPSQLAALNKTFQDHAKLYNEQNNNFTELRQALNDFKGRFVAETAGIPTLPTCLQVLAERCGGAQLTAKREKHCLQLEYDRREVSEKCTGLPEDTLEALELFNRINRLVKTLLDRGPQVIRSLQIVLEDEHNLKKEVTKSDLPPDVGPDALRDCTENISRLRKLPGHLETIQKYSNRIFKEIVEGSKVLLQGDGQASA